MNSLKTANVVIISISVLIGLITLVVLGIHGNGNADKSRERRENICVSQHYQWIKDDCIYPLTKG